ncbi:hypothetical protein B0T14DRAFT_13571 [Immersiella caudata]|uniref:Uncharacterized protein n=1 Tax=Immersiella caudata TaxID=314043 RepID=A0AA39XDS8_9PEZI|nr:hypothetical protein B0T14DRAFT_13571 [Immersiella caudata]
MTSAEHQMQGVCSLTCKDGRGVEDATLTGDRLRSSGCDDITMARFNRTPMDGSRNTGRSANPYPNNPLHHGAQPNIVSYSSYAPFPNYHCPSLPPSLHKRLPNPRKRRPKANVIHVASSCHIIVIASTRHPHTLHKPGPKDSNLVTCPYTHPNPSCCFPLNYKPKTGRVPHALSPVCPAAKLPEDLPVCGRTSRLPALPSSAFVRNPYLLWTGSRKCSDCSPDVMAGGLSGIEKTTAHP